MQLSTGWTSSQGICLAWDGAGADSAHGLFVEKVSGGDARVGSRGRSPFAIGVDGPALQHSMALEALHQFNAQNTSGNLCAHTCSMPAQRC